MASHLRPIVKGDLNFAASDLLPLNHLIVDGEQLISLVQSVWLQIVVRLVVQKERINILWINQQITSDKSKKYINAAKFFIEPGDMKSEATHISEMLSGLPAVAHFDVNHSQVLSHLGICDQTSNTYQQPWWLVSRVNLSQDERVRSWEWDGCWHFHFPLQGLTVNLIYKNN